MQIRIQARVKLHLDPGPDPVGNINQDKFSKNVKQIFHKCYGKFR